MLYVCPSCRPGGVHDVGHAAGGGPLYYTISCYTTLYDAYSILQLILCYYIINIFCTILYMEVGLWADDVITIGIVTARKSNVY